MEGKYYDLPGFTGNMDTIVFASDYISKPKVMKKGLKLRIWFGEDLDNFCENDNSGKHCVEIVSKYFALLLHKRIINAFQILITGMYADVEGIISDIFIFFYFLLGLGSILQKYK